MADNTDDILRSLIKSEVLTLLPQSSEDSAEQLASSLVNNKIESMANLHFVKEDEIKEFVGLYNARKLISVWSTRGTRIQDNSKATSSSVPLGEMLRNSNYKVNWETLKVDDDAVIDKIKQKKLLSPTQLDDVVKAIVKQVKKNVTDLRRGFFKGLATDILNEYPASFKDIVIKSKTKEAPVHGTDNEKLTYKLKNRFDNSNRRTKTTSQLEAPDIPQAVGCIRWVVSSLPEGEDEVTLKGRVEDMKQMYELSRKDWDWEIIENNMTLTYGLQRADLNTQVSNKKKKSKKRRRNENDANAEDSDELEDPPIPTSTIISEYPFLMTPNGTRIHFQELTGVCFVTCLNEWIEDVQPSLIDFLSTKHEDNPRVRHQMRKAEQDKSCREDDAPVMAIMTMLVSSLNEEIDFLYKCITPGTAVAEVPPNLIPRTPCIFALGDNIFKAKKFFFSLDSEIRASTKSFKAALMMAFCSYFVFNILYPDDLANTLDFIQRAILDIDPKGRSRVHKRKRGPNTVAYALNKLQTQYKVYEEKLGN